MERNKRLGKAILLIILSAFFFALMNMFVSLSGDVPVVQKTFFRNLFAMLIASGAMIKNRHYILPKKGERAGVILRSLFGLLGMFGNFYALSRLAVADASLLNKMSPFFAIIFSAVLLKERPDKVQTACILTAFFGAMFVLKPSFQNADLLPSCAGFLGGAFAGLAYTFVRKLTGGGTKSLFSISRCADFAADFADFEAFFRRCTVCTSRKNNEEIRKRCKKDACGEILNRL